MAPSMMYEVAEEEMQRNDSEMSKVAEEKEMGGEL